ncbi:MAG: hypothetical protein JWQ59_444 [Cryobacterium sp.]|nr:hypothetical protein [Cryobacterium sp.]
MHQLAVVDGYRADTDESDPNHDQDGSYDAHAVGDLPFRPPARTKVGRDVVGKCGDHQPGDDDCEIECPRREGASHPEGAEVALPPLRIFRREHAGEGSGGEVPERQLEDGVDGPDQEHGYGGAGESQTEHVTPYADRLASEVESAHGEANDRADSGCQESA